ncbi:MAG: BatA domain-containing protein, partial [Pirellulaceae bacterium]
MFTYQALTWGFLIALVPLLIHLINMMRHRRVKWAAMEFLLKSYKKHRKWVWLKQLLLLLLRMLVIAMIVALLAQADFSKLSLFGFRFEHLTTSEVTHHYVLIDDSYSMSERAGERSAFEIANQVLTGIGNQAKKRGQHHFTLLRFSR